MPEGNGNTGAGEGQPGESTAIVNADGTFAENWRDGLPEDIRDHPELKNAKDFHSLCKTHINLQGRLGKSVQLPDDKTDEADRAVMMGEIYNKLGRPDTPNGYEVARPQLPEGMQYSEQTEIDARKLAHKIGLNKEQFTALYNWFNTKQVTEHNDAMKHIDDLCDKAEVKLKEEFPEQKDYEGVLECARRAYDMYGGEEFAQMLMVMGLNNNPLVVRTFFEIYRQHHADEFVGGVPGSHQQGRPGVLNYKSHS